MKYEYEIYATVLHNKYSRPVLDLEFSSRSQTVDEVTYLVIECMNCVRRDEYWTS